MYLLEIEKLKKEINNKKIKKYKPVLENGWIVDPDTPQEFMVFKFTNCNFCIY